MEIIIKKMPRKPLTTAQMNFQREKHRADILQPLNRNGYSDPNFTKTYGADKNPYANTFRDIRYKGFSDKHKRKIGLQEC